MGKLAIVTGASRGIGAAIARKLAENGCDVVINCISNLGRAEKVAEECRAYGGNAYVRAWDVADYDACRQAVQEITEQLGTPDILVNNAGITRDGLMVRMKPEKWNEVIQANLNSVFYMTSLVGAQMVRAKRGSIVNITSISGLHGNFGQVNYTAAKAGVIGLTKTASKEMGSRGIRVNAVAPGFTETDMTNALSDEIKESARARIALGRFGTPEEIAEAAAFLSSDKASYITGQVLCVDGNTAM
ncbi:MAG TPA: 3-oxoacyl-[acyl-carrier-protein] reductase [Clostridiales bacterium]|nr:3-oxoacyl-[acyl-carrier-protein] reductase [Clostridiales bacterium]